MICSIGLLSGLVVDYAGRPISGAAIQAEYERSNAEFINVLDLQADSDGRFHEYLREATANSRVDLSVSANQDPSTPSFGMVAFLGENDLKLTLPKTLPVKVHVVSTANTPLETFSVRATGTSSAGGEISLPLQSYKNGVVELRIPPGNFIFRVYSDSQMIGAENFAARKKKTTFRISARPVRVVTGTVRALDGTGVSHALVELVSVPAPNMLDYVAGMRTRINSYWSKAGLRVQSF